MAQPQEHKTHQQPTPILGGLQISASESSMTLSFTLSTFSASCRVLVTLGSTVLLDLAMKIVFPVCTFIGIVSSLVQWFLVSRIYISSDQHPSSSKDSKGAGYEDYLIEEEEGLNNHNLFVKCAETQSAHSEDETSSLFTEYQYVGVSRVAFAILIFLFLGSVNGFSAKNQPCTYNPQEMCKPALATAIFSTIFFLLGLNRYPLALDCFKAALLDLQDGLKCGAFEEYLERCKKLEHQSRTVAYDLSDWAENGFRRKFPELAEYISAVQIMKSEISGSGLFATKNVDAGTLVLVIKAIATERCILPEQNDDSRDDIPKPTLTDDTQIYGR